MDEVKRAMAHVSWKSHENAALNPKAHLRNKITIDQALAAPMIAYPLGMFDCCGVSDGAACAIVTTPEIAASLGKRDMVTIKALQLAPSNGVEMGHESWDGSYTLTTRLAAERAYREAGITAPREQVDLMEVHDCFSITELVLMEDLGFSDPGRAVHDVLDGRYDRDGAIPCQTDGGLKCFGHPVGASGLRMAYEIYTAVAGTRGCAATAVTVARIDAQSWRNSQSQCGERRRARAAQRLTHDSKSRTSPTDDAATRLGFLRRGARRVTDCLSARPAVGQGIHRVGRRLRHRHAASPTCSRVSAQTS